MYMPSLFNDNFFDDFMTFPFERTQTRKASPAVMKADIKETASEYQIEMELPGFKRENISASLEDGYLTITASHSSSSNSDANAQEQAHTSKQQEDTSVSEQPKERYLRRERYYGTYARRFFVGKYLSQKDIKAKFENGILTLSFPKEDQKKVEEAKYITID